MYSQNMGSPCRLDKLWPIVAQDFNEMFPSGRG
jgi:hypothetical protein